jgi:poly(hydroxyalkanoate) granule-associated protein
MVSERFHVCENRMNSGLGGAKPMAEQIVEKAPVSAIPDLHEATEATRRGIHTAWLVGLGVVGFAADGVSSLFAALAKKGEELEPTSRERLKKVGDKVGGAVAATTGGVKDTFEGLGTGVRRFARRSEEEVTAQLETILPRLGIPSRDEWKALNEKLNDLTSRFEQFRASFEPHVDVRKEKKTKKDEDQS